MRIQVYQWFFCLSLCVSSWAVADERMLQVELIVFQQSAPNTELFELSERDSTSVLRYARTSAGTKSMGSIYKRLNRSGDYRPFFYESWRIAVKSEQVSAPIHVSLPVEGLQGWIKVQRGHLLHAITDITYSPKGSLEMEGMSYHLTEKRRVLLNEVHYLDHPYFGVIVKVSPVD